MNIIFLPMRRDDRLTLNRAGDTLIVNGTPFDFSSLPEGAEQDVDTIGCLVCAVPAPLISAVSRR